MTTIDTLMQWAARHEPDATNEQLTAFVRLFTDDEDYWSQIGLRQTWDRANEPFVNPFQRKWQQSVRKF